MLIKLKKNCNSISIVVVMIFFLQNYKFRECYCDEWEYKLVHEILKNYDSAIRPSLNHTHTLNVTFGLALAQIIDVVNINLFYDLLFYCHILPFYITNCFKDERNMIITTNCWLNQVNYLLFDIPNKFYLIIYNFSIFGCDQN
jgi:hypothetical protein